MISIEDDTLREGMQAPSGCNLDLDTYIDLVKMSASVGCEHIVLGFPVSSTEEIARIRKGLEFLSTSNLPIKPWVLARTCKKDAELFASLASEFPFLGAALFRGVSPIREKLEGWQSEDLFRAVDDFLRVAGKNSADISLNLEDVTRTPEPRLDEILTRIDWHRFESVALCDTVGAAHPKSTSHLVAKFRGKLPPRMRIIWHGHNDLGLAMANALSAIEQGVDTISGTFVGIGERAGNIALEQFCFYANEFLGRDYTLNCAIEYCRLLVKKLNLNLPGWTPLLGEHIVSTQAGTHAAAIIKSEKIETSIQEEAFLPFSPDKVMQKTSFLLGPQAGFAIVEHVLKSLDKNCDEAVIFELLEHCKKIDKPMQPSVLQDWYWARRNQ